MATTDIPADIDRQLRLNAWAEDARYELHTLAEKLVEARGLTPASAYPIHVGRALDHLSQIAGTMSKDKVRREVERHKVDWATVGRVFGISKQGAHQRFR